MMHRADILLFFKASVYSLQTYASNLVGVTLGKTPENGIEEYH